MGPFNWINDLLDDFGSSVGNDEHHCIPGINSATGLPMMDCSNTIDVAGNPFGVDLHDHDTTSISDGFGGLFSFDDYTWSSSSIFSDDS